MRNRGRFQAQGVRLEESESWAKNTDINVQEGLDLINILEQKLPIADSRLRVIAFGKAKQYVANAGKMNGVDAPVSKSYRVKQTKSERVDIEIIVGRAFIKKVKVII